MYVSTHFRRLAQKSRSLLVLGALALHGAFATPVLAQTQVTNTANVTLPTGIVDSNTANNTSSVTVAVQALPRLTLVKQVVNDNGGTAVATAWTLTATGPATTISGATGTAAVTSAAVQAGSYALTESGGPAGYAASTWSCVKNGGAAVAANTISLVGGDVATCTITNNDQSATLTLVKTVINDNGGTATVSNFPLTATGPTTITGVSGTAAVTNAAVNAGVYTLSEVTAAGYAAGTWSCTAGTLSGNQLTLANGQSASCSITNNDQAATLTLVKTVINDNGGTATVSNFPLTATGPTTITGVSGTAAVTNASVNAGVYTLSEVTAAGYAAGTWSCTAGTLSGNQLTLANGQSASCSITNNDQASTLTLVKTVVNTGGGTATVSNFPLTATGPTTITGVSGTAAVTGAPVNAGVYTLSEATVANYTAGSWSCTAGTLSGNQLTLVNGQSATCSITNTFQPAPALVLDKTASPTTVTAAGQVVTYSFLVSNTGNVAINALQINETAFSGTGAAPAINCPVSTLAAGANTTCTGTYAVTQQDIDAGSVTNTATASGANPAGGTTTSPADSATVTSTATPNVSIVKTGPATVVASSSFQYTLTLTNNGSRSTGTNLIVQDQLPAGMQATAASGAACTNLSTPGALLTCTVPGPIVPGGTAVVTLTVTAPAASGLANTTRTFTNYAATNPTGTGNPGTPPGSGCVNSATTSCGSVNTVVLSPYLQLNKSASGATFTLGVPASYTLEVDNSGATATAVASTITDVMPAGLTIGSLPSGCTVSGQTVTCTIPAGLAAGAVASFVIPVTPTGAAVPQVINTATVSGGGDPGCPVQGRCSESVTTTVGFTSTLTLDKTASPTTMSAVGQVVTYSFLVSNTGNVEVTALQINETAFSGTGAAPVITCPVNTLAAGANTTCTGTYTVTQQDIDAGSLTNTATASGNSPTGSTTTSPPDSATVTSTAAPALTVAKTVTSTGPYALGSTISYSVVATNSGTVTLNNVVVSDPLLAAPNSTTCATLAPGASCTLTGSYAVQQTDVDAGQVVNTATADSNETDPETGTTTTPITQTPSQTLTKVLTNDSTGGLAAVGDVLTYTVTLTNTGNTTLANVVVNDPMTTPASVACASVAPGAICQLVGTYTVTQADAAAGNIRNTAFVTGPACPAGSTDPTCTTTIDTPVEVPQVNYSKSVILPVGQTEVSVGDTLTYTLQVQVSDTATTAPVTLTDTLGTGLTLANVIAGPYSCGNGNPLVCTLPSGTVPGTYVVTYTATVNDLASGFVRNTVVATGDDAPTCQGSCQTETIVTEPLPAIISYGKTAVLPVGRTQVVAGDVITYTLTTTVAAAPTSGVLTLTDTLGAGLTFGTVTSAGAYTCTGTQPLVCTLPTGTTPGVYEVSYTATVNAQASGVVRNAVVGTSDDNPVCATDCDVETPVASPTILVNKSANPASGTVVQPGQVITYVLSVEVGQAATRAAVTLADTPGQGLTLGATPAGCAYNGTTMTCTLPAGTAVGTHTFTYTATVAASANGRVSNVVVANNGDPTGDPPTCQSCSTEHQVNLPEIRLSKSAGAREVKVGDLVRYTLTVENVGSSDLVNGRIIDTPPAGFSYVEGSLVAGDADQMATVSGNQPIRIEGVDVRAGETATLVYVMRVGAGVRPGTHVNQAQVRSITDEPVSNVATAEVTLTADALIDDSLLMGTVFNDRDGDGWQDSAALSGVKVQGGFAPGAYIANSTTVDRGAGPQPEPDASSPMLHGIAVGKIAGRQSVAEPIDAHEVVIRQRLSDVSFTNDFVLTNDQGVTVRMDAAGNTRTEQSGDAAKGLNAAAPTVERRVSQGEGGYVVDYVIRNAGIDERGIPGVRIASVEGLLIETDQFGRYHLAGVSGGAWERGRNFILKVDPSTLPTGAEFTTDNPLLRRITPGVPVRFDFGVKLPEQVIEGGEEQVELELGDVFFAPGSAEVREQYQPVIEAMAAQVRKHEGGEVVINANGDSEGLAFQRAEAVKGALLAQLDGPAAKALVVSARGSVDDPGSLVVGVDEGGALLGTVLFDTDKSAIRPEFETLLDKIATSLEKRGGGSIAIVGHTDLRGSHAYNTALGMRRAKAVYEAIAKRLSPEVRAKVRVEASNDPTAPVGVRK